MAFLLPRFPRISKHFIMPRRSRRPKPRFYLENKTAAQSPILMVYHYGLPKALRYSTGEFIKPSLWDQKAQRVKASKLYESDEITKYLEKLKAKAIEVFDEYGVISITDFRNEIDYRMGFLVRPEDADKVDRLTLLEYIPVFIKERETNAQTAHQRGTNKNFGVWHNVLLDYCKYVKKDISYDDIDWNWIKTFTNFCFSQKDHSQNNVNKGISYIKQFVNEARKAGHTDNRMVSERNFNIKKTPTTKVVFYIDDFEKLYRLDVSKNPRLQKTKDLNIIGGFTGMRHNMWKKINKDLRKKIDGEYFIEVFTTKTKAQIAVPLDDMLKETLDRLNWEIPVLSRQRFSDYSKELWELAGVTEKEEAIDTRGGEMKIELRPKHELFHPHCLRRSFASNFYLMGIPAAYLMPITGHKSEKMFFKYINIEKRLNASYVSKYMKQLNKMKKIVPNLKAI